MKMQANSDTYHSWFENPYTQPCEEREPGGYNLCSAMSNLSRRSDMVAKELAAMGIGNDGDEPEGLP